jgi:glucose-1-phosphate cytidylyltransferase
MKVILFCGGLGLRLHDYSARVPKPLVPVGRQPLLLHLMRYYAHFGHTEFILCLGHQAAAFQQYFLAGEGQRAAARWQVHCVDTGPDHNLGQRLLAVRPYLRGEEMFLVNYADVLTDLPLPAMLAEFRRHGRVASFLAYQPTQSCHVVALADDGQVRSIAPIGSAGLWVNAGFMVMRPAIFDYLHPGEELVEQPFQRLIAADELMAYRYQGFWAAMDTLKDKLALDGLYAKGSPPWEVWRKTAARVPVPAPMPVPAAEPLTLSMPLPVVPQPARQVAAW